MSSQLPMPHNATPTVSLSFNGSQALQSQSQPQGLVSQNMESFPTLSHIMTAPLLPHIMATPSGGFTLGLVAYPRAENQGENTGFLVQVVEFGAYNPEELPPVVITNLGM